MNDPAWGELTDQDSVTNPTNWTYSTIFRISAKRLNRDGPTF
jgi:hypothetical protein